MSIENQNNNLEVQDQSKVENKAENNNKTAKSSLESILKSKTEGDDKSPKPEKIDKQVTPQTGISALNILLRSRAETIDVSNAYLEKKSEQGRATTGKDSLDYLIKSRNCENRENSKGVEQKKIEKVFSDQKVTTKSENQKSPSEMRLDKNGAEYWQNHPDSIIRERFQTAYTFYREEASFSHDRAIDHMKGINFNRDVSIETIKAGETLKQYQSLEQYRKGETGQYFTKDSDKSELGIQGVQLVGKLNRVIELYVVKQDVQALKSTAKDVEDWNGSSELFYGGGEQFFIAISDQKVTTNTEQPKLPSEMRWNKNWAEHLQNHPDSIIRERFQTAYTFYREEASFSHDSAIDHMKGINFNRDVSIETIKAGEPLKQYQSLKQNQEGKTGQYFTKDSDKSELGIQGKSVQLLEKHYLVIELYVVKQDVQALKSTAKDVTAWRGSNGELFYGDAEQFFITEPNKLNHIQRS
ncbi:polymorphic toxin type 46 domain-containing protein [Pseudanabaena sp. ABRG5-3]|uniref:polymorphic toxin type 46 domain-containing protein n=1 Tax=Pseudanabaena sp. ABRG5-3 TaxID=685565 RepID=UPI000DC70C7E|nr:polymorphic toxin type 46 domain-containing protein [Pseudanabaena sp. ABRG5-3]BBC22889.1 hypothetical protein ABRG53_0632 [Pseudanabaena sp. ABRG5-3]